jgi:hypothetical protein
MKFYVSKSFSTRNPQTGKTVSVLAGSKISQTQYNKLSKNIIQRCGIIPARNAPRSDNFDRVEFDYLVTQYINGVDNDSIITGFYQQFPNHPVNGGVECQLRIIAGQDNTTDDNGLQNPSHVLLTSMMYIAPHRFV